MIAVPDATDVADRLPADARLELGDQLRGEPVGKVGNGRSSTIPISSQWPVTESLPFERSAIRPNAAVGAAAGGMPLRSTSRDRPIAARLGIVQRHVRRDVAERVAALVLVQRGIGQFADADAVEDDDDRALKH